MAELSCCVSCGRDTRAGDHLCSKCRGGYVPANKRIRKTLDGKTPVPEDVEPVVFETNNRYHGQTARDDV